MPSAFATFPLTTMTVEESVHYQTLGFAVDNVWLSATSSSYGYLRLGPGSRLFDTTMSHELHCLRVLNLAFTEAWSLETGHIHHCLNYLRQSILCDCDLTLEPGDFERRDFTTTRMGGNHICRDWSVWYDIMDRNYKAWLNGTR